jgi:hypothetical protein
VAANGPPALVHAVSRDEVYLFYPDADRVVLVRREGIPPGTAKTLAPIPGHFFRLLPEATVRMLSARRDAAKRRAHRRPSPRRAAPAAAAPDPAVRLADFDVAKLVARLRAPLSAADPGVGGWRQVRLADGRAGAVARHANVEYRVEPAGVRAAIPVAGGGAEQRAGIAAARVNRAVFGTRAGAVSTRVKPWLAEVAASRHRGARVARRVEGRTVQIHLDRRRDLLLYTVGAN